jgi:AP-2 complex subunit alpha
MLSESKEYSDAIISAIQRDITNSNEINCCLALHAIANIGSRQMVEQLSTDVHQLLVGG